MNATKFSAVTREKTEGRGVQKIERQRSDTLGGLGVCSSENFKSRGSEMLFPAFFKLEGYSHVYRLKMYYTCNVNYKEQNRLSLKQVFYLSETQSQVLVCY